MPEIREKKLWNDDDFKYFSKVFDFFTMDNMRTLEARGIIKEIHGVIEEGKESVVVLCEREDGPCILKIFKIETTSFKKMEKYIVGDVRFKNISKDRKKLTYLWCRKEFSNLKRAYEAGVSVPCPYGFLKNLLVMEAITTKNGELAPSLDEVKTLNDAEKFFYRIVDEIKKLYHEAKLVHSDISEFNILNKDGVPVLLDFAQAVVLSHPMADEFLRRDVNNITTYFARRFGVQVDRNEILEYVTGKG